MTPVTLWASSAALAVVFTGHNGSSTMVVTTDFGACIYVCEDVKKPRCRTVITTAGEVRIPRAPGEWAIVIGAQEAYSLNWDQERRQASIDYGKQVRKLGRLEVRTDTRTYALTVQLETISEPVCRFMFSLPPR